MDDQKSINEEKQITVEVDIAYGVHFLEQLIRMQVEEGSTKSLEYEIAQDLLEILFNWTEMGISYKVINPLTPNGWPVIQLTGPVSKIREWYLRDYDPGEAFEDFLKLSQVK